MNSGTLKGLAMFGLLPVGLGAMLTGIGFFPGLLLLGAAVFCYWLGDRWESDVAKAQEDGKRASVTPPPMSRPQAVPPPIPQPSPLPGPRLASDHIAGPPLDSREYHIIFFREARRFFRQGRNRALLEGPWREEFRGEMLEIYYRHDEAQAYIHPSQLLSLTRAEMVRQSRLP